MESVVMAFGKIEVSNPVTAASKDTNPLALICRGKNKKVFIISYKLIANRAGGTALKVGKLKAEIG